MKKQQSLVVTATVVLVAVCCFGNTVAAQSAVRTKHPYASERPLSDPTVFGDGIISTGDFDSHAAFTPDGKTVYFVRSTPTFSLWTILTSRFENGRWNTPEVAPFSGQYSDADPFIAPDDSRLYFISNRPVAGKSKPDLDIWVMERTGTRWSELG